MRAISFVLFSIFASASALAADDPYYDLIYDFEVGNFCGLVRQDVFDAYTEKRADLESADTRSKDQLTKTRIRAMAAADLEFQNRGLGGYKPWCQSDGQAGIERILK